jgi:hypothetical protein
MTTTTTSNGNTVKINSQYKIMSPVQIYLEQINACIDSIRATNNNLSYTPNQLGGIFMQQNVLTDDVVLQVINFSVTGSST